MNIMVSRAVRPYVCRMVHLFRYSLAIVLAALVALTGLAIASERGMSRVAGRIVLCTGHGPVAVWVDASGQPVNKIALCPDQTASLMGALDVPEPGTGFAPAVSVLRAAFVVAPRSSVTAIEPRGRSPPAWL